MRIFNCCGFCWGRRGIYKQFDQTSCLLVLMICFCFSERSFSPELVDGSDYVFLVQPTHPSLNVIDSAQSYIFCGYKPDFLIEWVEPFRNTWENSVIWSLFLYLKGLLQVAILGLVEVTTKYRIRLIKRKVRVEVGKIFCRRGFVKHPYNCTPQWLPIGV